MSLKKKTPTCGKLVLNLLYCRHEYVNRTGTRYLFNLWGILLNLHIFRVILLVCDLVTIIFNKLMFNIIIAPLKYYIINYINFRN